LGLSIIFKNVRTSENEMLPITNLEYFLEKSSFGPCPHSTLCYLNTSASEPMGTCFPGEDDDDDGCGGFGVDAVSVMIWTRS
jgi:hypothetical protein